MNYAIVTASNVQMIALLGIVALSVLIAHTPSTSPRNMWTLEHTADSVRQFEELSKYYADQAERFEELAAHQATALPAERVHPAAAPTSPLATDRASILRDYYLHRAAEDTEKHKRFAARAANLGANQLHRVKPISTPTSAESV